MEQIPYPYYQCSTLYNKGYAKQATEALNEIVEF